MPQYVHHPRIILACDKGGAFVYTGLSYILRANSVKRRNAVPDDINVIHKFSMFKHKNIFGVCKTSPLKACAFVCKIFEKLRKIFLLHKL